MKDLAILLGALACITQVYGYWIYNKAIYKGDIKPNATSWGLWGLGSAVAYWSYTRLDNGWIEDMLPLVCAVICFGTFAMALIKGKFEKAKREDILIGALDIMVIAFWLSSKSDVATNVWMQIDVVISFLPILRDSWRKPQDEQLKPWIVWCVAYTLMFASVLLVMIEEGKAGWSLMYPSVYFVLHLAVALVVKFRTAKP
ncbi:MAG TPA: hypothetical protein VHD69_00045 [Candidatus Paceibacterota bacterium]|jgi:hypothetical protein|nr:hypothetical protein [Candidatus Paceibacterota bacterium]